MVSPAALLRAPIFLRDGVLHPPLNATSDLALCFACVDDLRDRIVGHCHAYDIHGTALDGWYYVPRGTATR